MLSEVERYQPPEPAAAEIDARIAEISRRVGSPDAMQKIMAATGMTSDRLRLYLRDDLRLTTYLNQRFGTSAKPSDAEVTAYYREHAAEFTVGGTVQPVRRRRGVDPWTPGAVETDYLDQRLDGIVAPAG